MQAIERDFANIRLAWEWSATNQHVTNGTHSIEADLTATKSPGIFPAGNYQGTVTVRCE